MLGASAIVRSYNIGELTCSVYAKALSTENRQAGFMRSGILRFSPEKVPMESLLPSTVYAELQDTDSQATVKGGIELLASETLRKKTVKNLKRKEQKTKETKSDIKGKPRKTIRTIFAGQELTTKTV